MNLRLRAITFAIFVLVIVYLTLLAIYKLLKWASYGKPENRTDRIGERIKGLFKYTIAQKRVLRNPAGLWHFLLFYSFLLVITVSMEEFIKEIIPTFSLRFLGVIYAVFRIGADYAGIFILSAIIAHFFRRKVLKQVRYIGSPGIKRDMSWILYMIGAHTIFSYLLQSIMVPLGLQQDPDLIPVSNFLVPMWESLNENTLFILYHVIWWFHAFSVWLTLLYIFGTNPWFKQVRLYPSKHFHILGSFLSVFFRNLNPPGRLVPINFEDETLEVYGVDKIEDFTWIQLLNVESCVGCGRCQEVCPAFLNGQPLSPKSLILDLKYHLLEKGPILDKQRKGKELTEEEKKIAEKSLIGEVIKKETLWSCVTCDACETACPMFIEHHDKIVDMRRSLVMMESDFPEGVDRVFRNLEVNGNPWGLSKDARADWAKDLDVKFLKDHPDAEYLLWVGCAGSFADRNKKTATAMVKILRAAGIDFAILGKEEKCTGDPARRLGNEYLFQELAMENVATLNSYNVKQIITFCPHCFNTLKNEYKDFGGDYEVVHAVDFVNNLLKQGKLELDTTKFQKKMTYHDSCYLGRHNGIYNAPREILLQFSSIEYKEMEMNKDKAMCCGAGGGRFWYDMKEEQPINKTRAEMAVNTGCEAVGVSCPFCAAMFEDGMTKLENDGIVTEEQKPQVVDLIEIVAQTLKNQE